MSAQCNRIDSNLIVQYEILRAQILSAGISSPLSRTDRRIISEGLFQWASKKQTLQQKIPMPSYQRSQVAITSASFDDCPDIGVIDLIASMTIQSIVRNQKVA